MLIISCQLFQRSINTANCAILSYLPIPANMLNSGVGSYLKDVINSRKTHFLHTVSCNSFVYFIVDQVDFWF